MGKAHRHRTKHTKNRDTYRKYRTRNYTRDLDQVHDDLKPENAVKLTHQAIDPDMPGFGQHYCLECARHFINAPALDKHKNSKLHKRRLKVLKEVPYSHEEANAGAGIGILDNGKRGGQVMVADDDVSMDM